GAAMRTRNAAENRKVAALIQYTTCGLDAPTIAPARTGPSAVALQSAVWRSDVARGSSTSSTRFGRPASTAGRKNEFATPATPASTTIAGALSTNGSAAKTARRDRSAITSRRLRDTRSISGPAVRPTATDGSSVTTRSALTHHADPVRFFTSTVSAIVAIHVPSADPSVATKSWRKP